MSGEWGLKTNNRTFLAVLCLVAAMVILVLFLKDKYLDNIEKRTLLSLKIYDNKYSILYSDNMIEVYSEDGRRIAWYTTGNESILDGCASDLERDNKGEIILLTLKDGGEYADNLVVLSLDSDRKSGVEEEIIIKEIYRNDLSDINPWKVQTCDVDGDGKIEISLGVYKTSPLHPVMAKRPFIYDWVNGGIFPKWRGSRLSRPFDDYVFLDIDSDGKDELISIEYLSDGDKVLASYLWKGFGFEKIAESQSFDNISSIQVEVENSERGKTVLAQVKEGSKWHTKEFYYDDGMLLSK